VLAGLLRPHAGRVRVLGAELPGERWKAWGRVGYIGHEPLLYRELSIRENLAYQAGLQGVASARVNELVTAVGLERRADEPLRDLSRGMVQRAAVARALLPDPPLLLLDEAWASLDPAATERLAPLIGRGSGKTRVLVTHDVDAGLLQSDVALGLKGGTQVLAGPAAGFDSAALRELYYA
jgi:ABC-type multidrug transport system ATPase subunit